jgi:hypothetical protein
MRQQFINSTEEYDVSFFRFGKYFKQATDKKQAAWRTTKPRGVTSQTKELFTVVAVGISNPTMQKSACVQSGYLVGIFLGYR